MALSTTSIRTMRGAALTATAAIALTTLTATGAAADEKHTVSSGETVSHLAHRYDSSVSGIVSANRLNAQAMIVVGQTLVIPTGASSPKQSTAKKAQITHKVSSGDTVWDLARKHGTTVGAIIKANGLNTNAVIYVGQSLVIPGTASTVSNAVSSSSTTKSSTHQVVAGDTVWDIARTYGSTVTAIVKANKLPANGLIRVGQNLSIPGASASSPAQQSPSTSTPSGTSNSGAPKLATDKNLSDFGGATVTYTVASGDTLSRIAAKHGVSVDSIVKASGLKSASLIVVGQKLTISGGTPSGLVGDSFAGRTYSAPVVGAANQNKATLQSMDVPTRAQMQAMVVAEANRQGVDPSLAQAVAFQESGFNMRAVSPANAIGTMQVIPTSGEWASDLVGRDLNLLVPQDNVTAGVAILKHLTRAGKPLNEAIAGYYQGEASVRKYGLFSDTKGYVASVTALMDRF